MVILTCRSKEGVDEDKSDEELEINKLLQERYKSTNRGKEMRETTLVEKEKKDELKVSQRI
jgi:hypothetical protein